MGRKGRDDRKKKKTKKNTDPPFKAWDREIRKEQQEGRFIRSDLPPPTDSRTHSRYGRELSLVIYQEAPNESEIKVEPLNSKKQKRMTREPSDDSDISGSGRAETTMEVEADVAVRTFPKVGMMRDSEDSDDDIEVLQGQEHQQHQAPPHINDEPQEAEQQGLEQEDVEEEEGGHQNEEMDEGRDEELVLSSYAARIEEPVDSRVLDGFQSPMSIGAQTPELQHHQHDYEPQDVGAGIYLLNSEVDHEEEVGYGKESEDEEMEDTRNHQQEDDERQDREPDVVSVDSEDSENSSDERNRNEEESEDEEDEEDGGESGEPVIDPEQIMRLHNFRERFIPTNSGREEYANRVAFLASAYYVDPPEGLKPYDPEEQGDEICMETVDLAPYQPPPLYQYIKIAAYGGSMGHVTLTLKPTENSESHTSFVPDVEAFNTVIRVAEQYIIRRLCLEFVGVDTTKYVHWLMNGLQGLLPVRYLDWWNAKQLRCPDGDEGVALTTLASRCDPQILRQLGVHLESWRYKQLLEIRQMPFWSQLTKITSTFRLPCPTEACLHMSNFDIKVPIVNVNEYEMIIEAFQKKLPFHPTPSFEIRTEKANVVEALDEPEPMRLPLYVSCPMIMNSAYTLVVKFEEFKISGRVIRRPTPKKIRAAFLKAVDED